MYEESVLEEAPEALAVARVKLEPYVRKFSEAEFFSLLSPSVCGLHIPIIVLFKRRNEL